MGLMSKIGEMFGGGFEVLSYYSQRFIAESQSGEIDEGNFIAISQPVSNRQYDSDGGASSSDGRFRLKY